MQNAGLDEKHAATNIARKSINNLRYADDTTLILQKEELKSHVTRVKEESKKASLKLNIQKTKIMTSGPMANRRGKCEAVTDFIFLGSKITVYGDCGHEIKRRLFLRRKAMTNLDIMFKSRDITANKGPYSQSYVFFQ